MPKTKRTIRTIRPLSQNTIRKLGTGTATNRIKTKKSTTRPTASSLFSAHHIITVYMDRYLRSLFENLHIKKIGQQKYNKNKEFEKVINSMRFKGEPLIKLIHIYTRDERNVPIAKKIYKNILKEYEDKEDFFFPLHKK